MAISKKSWLGVAREATPGTLIATPTLFVPAKSTFTNKTKYAYLDEERGTRDGNYGRVPTVKQASGKITGPFYADSRFYELMAFMGPDTPSQPSVGTDPTVWLHTLALVDIPPTLSLTKSFDAATYQFAYGVVHKLVFKFTADGKLLEMESDVESQFGTKMTTPPTPTFSTLLPFAGYVPTIKFNAVTSNDVEEMTITMEQKVTLFYPANGSQAFATAYFGERTAKIDGTVRFDADTFYNSAFFTSNGTDQHINIDFEGQNISHAYNNNLILDFPIVGFDDAEHDLSKDNVLLKFKATARPGASANSLFSATVQNTVASYTV